MQRGEFSLSILPGFVPETAFGGLEFHAELEAGGPAEETAGGVDGFVEEVVGGDVGDAGVEEAVVTAG